MRKVIFRTDVGKLRSSAVTGGTCAAGYRSCGRDVSGSERFGFLGRLVRA